MKKDGIGATFTCSMDGRARFQLFGIPEPALRWKNGRYWLVGASRPLSDYDQQLLCDLCSDAVSEWAAEHIRKVTAQHNRGELAQLEWHSEVRSILNRWRIIQHGVYNGLLAGEDFISEEVKNVLQKFALADALYFADLCRAMNEREISVDMIAGGLVDRAKILLTVDADKASVFHEIARQPGTLAELFLTEDNHEVVN